MKTAASQWPIVPPDSRLLALEELTEKWGLTSGSSLRKWIIKQALQVAPAWERSRPRSNLPGQDLGRGPRLPVSSELLAEVLSEILEGIVGWATEDP
jgi:hypothetical protein